MPYNYSKLLGRITEKYKTRSAFSRAIGLSERSLSLKLNEKVPFKQPEITKACSLLDIKSHEIPVYFFYQEVQLDCTSNKETEQGGANHEKNCKP